MKNTTRIFVALLAMELTAMHSFGQTIEEEEPLASCPVVSYESLTPLADMINEEDLVPIPDGAYDEALFASCEASSKDRSAASNTAGWVVDKASGRNFTSPDKLHIFNISSVTDSLTHRKGVILSSGVMIKGTKTVNWTRRVLPADQLVEYEMQPEALSIGGFLGDALKWFTDKILPQLIKQIGKALADAVHKLFAAAEKWVQNLISDLFDTGKSSQVPKLYLANMQRSGAQMKSVEIYLTSIVASRSSSFTLSDRVFTSLYQPIVNTQDNQAGAALANAIKAIR